MAKKVSCERLGLLPCILAVLIAVTPLPAQFVTGRIVGVVHDPSGGVVPQAKVVATNVATQVSRETQTNAQGEYVFVDEPAGTYRLEASREGFRTTTIEQVVLRVLQTASVDIELTVGSVSQTVTVSSESTVLETQTSDVASNISQDEVINLPLDGRDYLQLATLTPGAETNYAAANTPSSTYRSSVAWGGSTFEQGTQNVGTNILVNGERENATVYRVDRVNVSNLISGATAFLPSPDSIAQMTVITGVAPAYISSPASVNVVTHGGTNNLHGRLYEYVKNSVFNAKNFFDVTNPPVRVNQFGVAVGGPIQRDKTFFFVNYDGFRSRIPATAYASLPTSAERGGDFSGLGPGGVKLPTIADPTTAAAFPGNVIPTGRISNFATQYNQYIPAPNFVGSGPLLYDNFVTVVSPMFDSDQGVARIDHSFSTGDRLFGRYSNYRTTNLNPGLTPLYGSKYPYSSQTAALSETHSFSPTLLNIFTFGYTRSILYFAPITGGGSVDYATQLGLNNLDGAHSQKAYGLPSVVFAADYGVTGGGGGPRGITQNTFEYQDDVSYVKGPHTLQFGMDLTHNQVGQQDYQSPNGFIAFLPYYTALAGVGAGSDYADYLLGLPFEAIGYINGSVVGMGREYNWIEPYVQDDWRVTKKLTLNVGLRYHYQTPPADKYNHEGYFNRDLPGFVLASSGQIHNGLLFPPATDFAPRVGFAWSPLRKTVFRGGYGIYYMEDSLEDVDFNYGVPPQYQYVTVVNPNNPVPLTMSQVFPPFNPNFGCGPGYDCFSVNPHDPTPYYQQWDFSLQQEIAHNTTVSVTYYGSHGVHLQRRNVPNQAVNGTTPIQTRRPFPQYGDILTTSNDGRSMYDSLAFLVQRTLRSGLVLSSHYVYANGFDTGQLTSSGAQDFNNRNQGEYGPSGFLIHNQFMTDVVYDLPFGRGKHFLSNTGAWNRVVSGWRVSAITLFQSGTQYTISANNYTPTGSFVGYRANRVCNGTLSKSQRTLTDFFDPNCFTQPAPNTFGNAGNGVITGPGLNNWDISAAKDTPITETKSLRFEAQFLNAFNHPQFVSIGSTAATTGFGYVFGAYQARNIQLALSFIF